MENNKKHYDFERTCVDEGTAIYVRNSVIKEYENNPKWQIGKSSIEKLPNGEYKVFVELTYSDELEKDNNNDNIRRL